MLVRSHSRAGGARCARAFGRFAVERLEPRRLLAAISWAAPVTGDFTDPARWVGGVVPGPADDVSFTVAGNYSVTLLGSASVRTLTIGNAGGGDPSAQPNFVVRGGVGGGAPSVLTVAAGVTNYGRLTLTSANDFQAAQVTVAGGALDNRGRLIMDQGAAGGPRNLSGAVNNFGTVDVNSTGALVGTGGVFVNTGSVNVAAGQTLFVNPGNVGANQVFRQTGGGVNIAGGFDLTAATFEVAGGAAGGPGTVNARPGSTVRLTGGTLDVDGGFAGDSVTFEHTGGASTGTAGVVLARSTLRSSGSVSRAGAFTMRRTSTLVGDVAVGQSIIVQGATASTGEHNAVLTSAAGFTNAGVILLEAVNSAYDATLAVGAGTLNNLGSIRVLRGTDGRRVLSADVVNTGTVQVGYPLALSKAGGTFRNEGTVTVAAGVTLTADSDGAANFTQAAGSLAGAGAFDMSDGTFALSGGNLDVDGGFTAARITFAHTGGNSTGAAGVVLHSSTFSSGGAAGRAGTFTLRRTCTIAGDIAAGQTLILQGATAPGGENNVFVTADAGFVNAGVITLTSIEGAYAAGLFVTTGVLTNSGTINIEPGQAGGSRFFTTDLANNGTVNINHTTVFSKATGSSTNRGAINIAVGTTFRMTGGSATFTQAAGTFAGAGTATVEGGRFNLSGGMLDVDGGLTVEIGTLDHTGGASTGAAGVYVLRSTFRSSGDAGRTGTFYLRRACTLVGDVAAGQALVVQGATAGTGENNALLTSAAGFTNAGTITLDAIDGNYHSQLLVTAGTFTNAGTLVINRGQGGGNRGVDSAAVVNTGTVDVGAGVGGSGSPFTLGRAGGTFTNSGNVTLAANARVTLACDHYDQTAGTTTLSDTASVTLPGAVRLTGGTLSGAGTIQGSLHNAARVLLPASIVPLRVNRGYVQTAAGTLELEFGSSLEFGRLSVVGTAALNGMLRATVTESFLNDARGAFDVVTATAVTGQFAQTELGFAEGRFEPSYTATSAVLTVRLDGLFVTNANDAGAGSLRQAILDANAAPGTDRIRFAIPGDGPHRISVLAALPPVGEAAVIDGYSQSGARVNGRSTGTDAVLKIELHVPAAPVRLSYALSLVASGSTVRGLVVNGFSTDGILVGGANCVIEGNFVGTNAAASAAEGDLLHGIRLVGSGNRVGGTAPASKNVLSGNTTAGVRIEGSGNIVGGNDVGFGRAASTTVAPPRIANGIGIIVAGASNVIGGSQSSARNFVAGNSGAGVVLSGSAARLNVVSGNTFGYTGLNGPPPIFAPFTIVNGGNGVELRDGARENVIGGLTAVESNSIANSGGHGLAILGSTTVLNVVQGNRIGRVPTVSFSGIPGNAGDGVRIEDAADNVIGGTAPGAINTIYGNRGYGVSVGGSRNRVQGSHIGALNSLIGVTPNSLSGIEVHGTDNIVGGTTAEARNVISGNALNGVLISPSAVRTWVQGNWIGVSALGTGAQANAGAGILDAGVSSVIGGTVPGAGNLVSGNAGDGIWLASTGGSTVQGNVIGLDATGRPLGNGADGVRVAAGAGHVVGGSVAAAANVIAFNAGRGVSIRHAGAGAASASVRRNSIYGNTGPGIDLGLDGPTGNDPGDTDAGDNGRQNFPVLAFAHSAGGITTVDAGLNSTPGTLFVIDFYLSPDFTPAGQSQARAYLGSRTVATDGTGNSVFSAEFPTRLLGGQYLTATATNVMAAPTGETSEFSETIDVGGLPGLSVLDARVTEGVAGSTATATFTVTLSAAPRPVTVRYATLAGTGTAGVDYVSTGGVLSFAPGETAKTVMVVVRGDAAEELDETFTFVLSEPVGAMLEDGVGVGEIVNDDDTGPVIAGAPPLLLARQAVAGTIRPPGDVDVYAFDVTAGQVAEFDIDLGPAEALDAYLRLFDAAGNQIASNDNGPTPGEAAGTEPYLRHTFTTPGRYYVGVSAATNRTYSVFGAAGAAQAAIAGALPDAGTTPEESGAYRLAMTPLAQVVGRHVFYNNSAFDGVDPTPNPADDSAVAPDKRALLPGELAAFENVTSYGRGLNGIMIDVRDMPFDVDLTPADFAFVAGGGSEWRYAPLPASVTRRVGAGAGGSDRITITWPDGAIKNQWLQVHVLAAATGLPEADVFSFGNLVGDTGGGGANGAVVGASDIIATRSAMGRRATVSSAFDFNRDGAVNALDLAISRSNSRRTLPLPASSPSQRLPFAGPAGLSGRPSLIPSRRNEWLSQL